MKKLFVAIRQNDLQLVKELISNDPDLVRCTAKQPPKKDDGQSPLQVALKTGRFDMADYLLDMGADPNFMESEDCVNNWRTPALHDAVMAAVMESRWCNLHPFTHEYEVMSKTEDTDRAYSVLERMIQLGGNVNLPDSIGNNAVWRFCLSADQILPKDDNDKSYLFSDEVHYDLLRILSLLKSSGADFNYVRRDLNSSVMDFYTKGAVKSLLDEILNS